MTILFLLSWFGVGFYNAGCMYAYWQDEYTILADSHRKLNAWNSLLLDVPMGYFSFFVIYLAIGKKAWSYGWRMPFTVKKS